MRWLKYIVIGLTSLVIVSIAIVVTLVLLLEQDEFRDGLVYVVNRTTDHHLEINGPLEIDFSLSPSVNVSDIYFKTATEDFELNAAEIHIKIEFKSSKSSYLLVREILVRDSVVNIRQAPEEDDEDEQPSEPLDIRVPIVETLNVKNLAINYWHLDETEPLNISLDSLEKDNKAGAEHITMKGAGTIDGAAFKLEGESDAVEKLLTSDQPFSFKYHFDVLQSSIHVEGKISNPRETRDLDVAVRTESASFQSILQLLHVDAPDIGKLTATYRLAGTLDAPQMNDIDINVSKDKAELHVSGAVGNILTAEDIDLDFSSSISDAKLLASLLPEPIPRIDSLKTSGKLIRSAGILSIGDYTLDASGPRGHRLNLAGSARYVDAPQPWRDLKATLAIASPDTKFIRQFTEAVPLMGPVSGTASLSSDADALVIEGIKLTAGTEKKVRIGVQGDIGHITLAPAVDVSKINLKIDIAGTSARVIGDLVGTELPAIGPVKVNGRYTGSIASSSIKGLHLQAGTPEQLLINARGDIKLAALDGDKPLAGLGLDINLDAPSTASLTAITGTEIPALGHLKGTAHVGDAGGAIAITALDIKVDKGKDFQLAVNGSLADLEKQAGLDLQLELSATDLNTIGQLFDQSLPKEGPVKFSVRVKGSREKLLYNGRVNLRNTTMTSDLTGSFTGDRPRLAGSITIPDLDVHDIGIHPEKWAAKTSEPAVMDFDEAVSEQAVVAEQLFSKEPIDFSGLNAIDLDLEVTINKLSSTAASITGIYSHVLLDNGKLDIKPLKYTVDDDIISNDVMINSSTKPPIVNLLVTGTDIDLGRLLTNPKTNKSPIRGLITAKVDMRSRGQSPAELAANLDGEVDVVTENARVDKGAMNLIKMDVIGWAITNMVSLKKDINIDCAILMMHFNKGMGKTDLHIIDTPDTLIRIDANFDLVNETMDIVIVPEHKKRIFKAKQDPMEIHGPIANPQYKLVSLKDLTREAGRSYLLSPLTITASLLENITGLIVKPDEPKAGSCDKFLQ